MTANDTYLGPYGIPWYAGGVESRLLTIENDSQIGI